MNSMKLKTFLSLPAIALVLAGCASTPEVLYPAAGKVDMPTYVWDNSKSEALNVAQMAQPVGVGVGMRDYDTAEQATNGHIGGGAQAFDAVVMGLSQGIFGIFSASSMTGSVNDAVSWKPSVVQFIPVAEFGPIDQPNAYKKLQEHFERQLKEVIVAKYPEMEWYGYRTLVNQRSDSYTLYGFKSDFCTTILKFHGSDQRFINSFGGERTFEKQGFPSESCFLSFSLEIASKTMVDGVENYVVVAESGVGQPVLDLLAASVDGYFMYPDYYTVPKFEGDKFSFATVYQRIPYTFVQRGDKVYPFVRP